MNLNRRDFIKISGLTVHSALAGCVLSNQSHGPYLTNCIKIGELTPGSVRIWVRLAGIRKPDMSAPKFERIAAYKPEKVIFPAHTELHQMEGAVPGSPGQVRATMTSLQGKSLDTGWHDVDSDRDFTFQFDFDTLLPDTTYNLSIQARSASGRNVSDELKSQFRTAPSANSEKDLLFTVAGDHEWWDRESNDGHLIYKTMRAMNPDFSVFMGDFVYYDRAAPIAKNVALARHKWNRMTGLPNVRGFYNHVPTYFQKDDHDTYFDDCYPAMKKDVMGSFTFDQGIDIHYEQTPLKPNESYRTFRWGKNLQIWLVEGREFRTPDPTIVPEADRTIWGYDQIEWFKKSVQASDATFKLLFSPAPMVGPDRDTKKDSYANACYEAEGKQLRQFLAENKMYSVTGDRHWQYVSVDDATGLTEFCHGAACDAHAGGWKQEDKRPQHRFLRVKGGFLSIQLMSEDKKIIFTHHDVNGNPVNKQTFTA